MFPLFGGNRYFRCAQKTDARGQENIKVIRRYQEDMHFQGQSKQMEGTLRKSEIKFYWVITNQRELTFETDV